MTPDGSVVPTLPDLLHALTALDGSDLHLTAGTPPQARVHGHLQRLAGGDLTPDATRALAYSLLTPEQQARFEAARELDCAISLDGLGRFRCNLFVQQGAVGAVYRAIPRHIRSLEALGLPPVIATLAERPHGLVLVTGPTGSGKSTTLAALIDKINKERAEHILTIEDPVEFLHPHQRCLVNQREVHADTESFATALRAALREDPDIVLIGELRDSETVDAALRIAETGHLTFGTLHTNSAAQTISRIVDIFPAGRQAQVRTQLSLVLEGIVCQTLVPRTAGGRVAAVEILVATPAIRHLVREDKVHQIYSAMQTGQEKMGMQTMNQSLAALYLQAQISLEAALSYSPNRDELQDLIRRGAARAADAGRGRADLRRPAGR